MSSVVIGRLGARVKPRSRNAPKTARCRRGNSFSTTSGAPSARAWATRPPARMRALSSSRRSSPSSWPSPATQPTISVRNVQKARPEAPDCAGQRHSPRTSALHQVLVEDEARLDGPDHAFTVAYRQVPIAEPVGHRVLDELVEAPVLAMPLERPAPRRASGELGPGDQANRSSRGRGRALVP